MSARRTGLLVAAIDEIASKGTRGMRVEEVAKGAGVSPGLIYHHFGDRATLLQSALEHIGTQADAYTHHSAKTGRDNLVTMLLAEIQDDESVRTNSAAWGELRDSAIFDLALRPTITALSQRWVDDIAEIVRTGQGDGSIDNTLEPVPVGIQLSAAVEGMSSRWLTGMLTASETRDHLTTIIDALLEA